ncbi:MAG TPA: DUF4007 family protein [Cyclobacteriaceae bacterium]|nr:DUF4007 family protein [Cyclobacteriaceae bacterium]HMY93747.1 DUF4007 family protein [Cyclobacteriaceae bacterium]HNA12598.1 DUF4007 family protein [Cyclobacteriaceae bacterium]HNE94742.1 DUF4007 family protein [Cyclobacteriaceae bacterium]HNI15074.1 DUF4007 family protein [Cyclobacteriaceae bacterium]
MKSKTTTTKLTFSGHESFQCRQLWLKKGYDFIAAENSFNSEDAVVELGVGKNMVASIRFWMKAFNLLTTDDKLTSFAHKLLSDDGWDPYLEDEASLWLLHYQLVKNNFASTYSIVFNELRRERIEFTKDNFISFVKRKSESERTSQINEKTISEDFSVMMKMYLRSDLQLKDKEESFSGLLTDLNLIKSFSKGKDEFLIIENSERHEIPDEVILYAILDGGQFDSSINLNNIEHDYNSAGSIFAINRPGLVSKIENLTSKFNDLVYKDNAGIKELQFKRNRTAVAIMNHYYAN